MLCRQKSGDAHPRGRTSLSQIPWHHHDQNVNKRVSLEQSVAASQHAPDDMSPATIRTVPLRWKGGAGCPKAALNKAVQIISGRRVSLFAGHWHLHIISMLHARCGWMPTAVCGGGKPHTQYTEASLPPTPESKGRPEAEEEEGHKLRGAWVHPHTVGQATDIPRRRVCAAACTAQFANKNISRIDRTIANPPRYQLRPRHEMNDGRWMGWEARVTEPPPFIDDRWLAGMACCLRHISRSWSVAAAIHPHVSRGAADGV